MWEFIRWCGVSFVSLSLRSSQDWEATYHEVMGLSSREKRSSLTTNNFGGSSLLVFQHEVEEFCFCFKIEERADVHPFLLERRLSSYVEEVKGIVRISCPYLERRSSLHADWGVKGALFLLKILEGPVFLLMELSSVSLVWRKLSVFSCRGWSRRLFFLEGRGA